MAIVTVLWYLLATRAIAEALVMLGEVSTGICLSPV